MLHIREQEKASIKDFKTEIIDPSDKEFKVMFITELGKRMDEQSENFKGDKKNKQISSRSHRAEI